jgi:hypothetical protein
MDPLFTTVEVINKPSGYGGICKSLLPYNNNEKLEFQKFRFILFEILSCYDYIASVINRALAQ